MQTINAITHCRRHMMFVVLSIMSSITNYGCSHSPMPGISLDCGITTPEGRACAVYVSWPLESDLPKIKSNYVQTLDYAESVWFTSDGCIYATWEVLKHSRSGKHYVRIYSREGRLLGEYQNGVTSLSAPTISEDTHMVAFLRSDLQVILGIPGDKGDYSFQQCCVLPVKSEHGFSGIAISLFGLPGQLLAWNGVALHPVHKIRLYDQQIEPLALGQLVGVVSDVPIICTADSYFARFTDKGLLRWKRIPWTGAYTAHKVMRISPQGDYYLYDASGNWVGFRLGIANLNSGVRRIFDEIGPINRVGSVWQAGRKGVTH